LVWNYKKLPLTLDHKNGVNSDDRPANLRFLCPNCDAQLPTRGGANRGRVQKSPGGFGIFDKMARRTHYTLPAEGATFKFTGSDAELVVVEYPVEME
jgi:hypothetical protein